MLNLNNCVAASVDHSYHDIRQTGLKPAKNAERKHFPNLFPPEHEKRWLCNNYSWCSIAVWPRRATKNTRKMKPRLCLGELTWVEPAMQSKSAVNLKKKQLTSVSPKLEPTIWSRDTGQRIPCFDRCQLIKPWMSNSWVSLTWSTAMFFNENKTRR